MIKLAIRIIFNCDLKCKHMRNYVEMNYIAKANNKISKYILFYDISQNQ